MRLICRWLNKCIYNVSKTPIHVYNIHVLYREIYNLFIQDLVTCKKVGPWRSFVSCFAASFIFTDTAHILCLSCQNNCKMSERVEAIVILIVVKVTLQHVGAYTVTVAQHESGPRKAICWSVTIYNTKCPVNTLWLLILELVQD